MPIYEDQMQYGDMLKAAQLHVCGDCGGILNVAWSAERNCYMLRCHVLSHNSITKHRKLTPDEIEGRKIFNQGETYMDSVALQKLDQEKMLERVKQARFPQDLSTQEINLIALVSREYGLDPLFGELMVYQGKPYITIDARRRKAQETGLLDGINSRPATKEERKARQIPEEDYLYIAEVWVKGAAHPFEGIGRVRAAEIKGSEWLPIVKDPGDMAEKRAESEGLRRAFHIPLPSFEEIITGEFKEIPPSDNTPKVKVQEVKGQSAGQELVTSFNRRGLSLSDIYAALSINRPSEITDIPKATALLEAILKRQERSD